MTELERAHLKLTEIGYKFENIPPHHIREVKSVRKKLRVKIGDIVVYVEDEKGNIILKKGELRPL